MAVEFELPVLQISMAAVDKMQGPDALRALWTVFTKTTSALQDGPRLENMTWRLWHRQLLLDRSAVVDDAVAVPANTEEGTIEVVSEDEDGSGDDWEDDSAPPSRDPTIQPTTVTHADKTGVSTRRQSSTTTLQRPVPNPTLRSRRLSSDPPVLSASQPTPSSRPALIPESRCNSSPEGTHSSHGTNIGRIISNLLPEKLEVAPPSSSMSHPSVLATAQEDYAPSTPKTQPVQFLIQSPSTPPDVSDGGPAQMLPTLMVITPTPRPTPPATPSTRARAVPTNIPSALLPGVPPLALNAPSTLDRPHSVLLPCPSASEQLVPAAALPLTPTLVSAPDLADDDSKKKIFYVQSPEGATASDDGRSHSSSSNSNTTSNVAVLSGQQASSLSSATTNEPASAHPLPEAASPTAQHVSATQGTNHARTSSGNAAYIRPRAAKGAKATKSAAARVPHRARPNGLTRTISNSSDKSRGGAGGKPKPTRQQSVSEEVVEDIEEVEGDNKQTSASTSQTVTSLPRASAAPALNMTPAAKSPERPRNNTPASRTVSSPAILRHAMSSVRSPPNVLAPAALVAPFTTIASAAPSAHTQQAPTEASRPPVNNNSSALMGLGRRAVHVETSSDLESDSEESWSDDETDSEDPLARAANEAGRQRSMFEKVPPKPLPPPVQRTGLLTNLMNPDPRIYPQTALHRQHNSAQNLAAVRRGAPTVLQTSRSTVAVPMAAAVTAEQVTTHVSVDPKGRAVGPSESRESRGSRGLRLKGRPEGDVDEEGSTDEENSMPNELSKTYAQRRLEALATRARVPPPPPMEQVRHGQAAANPPALAPRPAPQPPQATIPYDMDVRPIHSPRTVRRKMIAGELSESLRRNLMWERTSTRFAMGAGALGSGLRPLTGTRPGVQTTNSDRGPNGGSRSGDEDAQERSEARRLALARNKSWANDFHHAGW